MLIESCRLQNISKPNTNEKEDNLTLLESCENGTKAMSEICLKMTAFMGRFKGIGFS
jgi:hypothetical protein